MKNIFSFILICSLPIIGFCQNDTLVINDNYKWKVGVKGLFEKSQIPVLSPIKTNVYNFGVALFYKLGKSNSFIETGLFSLNRKFYLLYNIDYRNIQIPIKYRLETKIIYLDIGIYGSYLLTKKVLNKDKNYKETTNDRRFNIGYTGAIGIEKNISKQFSIFVEAEVSTDLTSTVNEVPFFYFNGSNPFYTNYGFSLGINYKIYN